MTTTNYGSIHPMVMKAARAMAEHEAKLQGRMFYAQSFIAQARAALTECGALDCLEALETFVWPHQDGCNLAETERQEKGRAAIAKVYGSAPE
jgi:hypothetical protein